jgi:hypothetical protein
MICVVMREQGLSLQEAVDFVGYVTSPLSRRPCGSR